MKTQNTKRNLMHTGVPLLCVLFVTAAMFAASKSVAENNKVTTKQNVPSRKLKDKAQRGGGKFIGNLKPRNLNGYRNLQGLAADSDAVIIGTPVSNVCKLSADEQMITTDYTVQVEQTFKSETSGQVTVSLPGGQVGFEDGTIARLQAYWFKPMLNNRRYVLFLSRDGDTDIYTPTGEAQGVYELTPDGMVDTHNGHASDPMRHLRGDQAPAFLKKLDKAIKE